MSSNYPPGLLPGQVMSPALQNLLKQRQGQLQVNPIMGGQIPVTGPQMIDPFPPPTDPRYQPGGPWDMTHDAGPPGGAFNGDLQVKGQPLGNGAGGNPGVQQIMQALQQMRQGAGGGLTGQLPAGGAPGTPTPGGGMQAASAPFTGGNTLPPPPPKGIGAPSAIDYATPATTPSAPPPVKSAQPTGSGPISLAPTVVTPANPAATGGPPAVDPNLLNQIRIAGQNRGGGGGRLGTGPMMGGGGAGGPMIGNGPYGAQYTQLF